MDEDRALPERLLGQPLYLLSLLGRQARAVAAEAVAGQGLKLGQVAALAVLAELGPASQRQIGVRLGKDPSDVVALVDELEAAGLVRRDRDPVDGRRHRVTPTRAGRGALRRAENALAAAGSEFLGALTDRQAADLSALAARVARGHR